MPYFSLKNKIQGQGVNILLGGATISQGEGKIPGGGIALVAPRPFGHRWTDEFENTNCKNNLGKGGGKGMKGDEGGWGERLYLQERGARGWKMLFLILHYRVFYVLLNIKFTCPQKVVYYANSNLPTMQVYIYLFLFSYYKYIFCYLL